MSQITEAATPLPRKKPRFALLLATGFGLGYLPKAPGTWGSFGGLALAVSPALAWLLFIELAVGPVEIQRVPFEPFVFLQCLLAVGLAGAGLWSAGRAAKYLGAQDPQPVVIDEVSGQQLALLLGGFLPQLTQAPQRMAKWSGHPLGIYGSTGVNWKYLVAGFILFRVFDIWKPFPARQAEMLPGGWGIMADDWVAAIYAALGLWLARALGL